MLSNSEAAEHAELLELGITAVFNTAMDYIPMRHIRGVEYSTVGLIDGPGNNLAAYHAATLKLLSLLGAKHKVLVHDHNGTSQSVAVCIMALHALYRRGWYYWLVEIQKQNPDAEPHDAHYRAFNRFNWRLISAVMEAQ